MAIWTHHDRYGTEPEPEPSPNPSPLLALAGVMAALAFGAWLTCH